MLAKFIKGFPKFVYTYENSSFFIYFFFLSNVSPISVGMSFLYQKVISRNFAAMSHFRRIKMQQYLIPSPLNIFNLIWTFFILIPCTLAKVSGTVKVKELNNLNKSLFCLLPCYVYIYIYTRARANDKIQMKISHLFRSAFALRDFKKKKRWRPVKSSSEFFLYFV